MGEPQQEERRVNRNKGRSRSRGKASVRTATPSRASAPSRGASPVRDSLPSRTAAPTRIALRPRPAVPATQASQPENRRSNAPRRRPQEISQPEVERETTNRVRVRPTTTPLPITRKFVPAFLQEPAGQSLDQAFGNVFNSEQTAGQLPGRPLFPPSDQPDRQPRHQQGLHLLLPHASPSHQRRFRRLQLHLSSSLLTASRLNLSPRTHSLPSRLHLGLQKSWSLSNRHSRLSRLNLSSLNNSSLTSPSSLNSRPELPSPHKGGQRWSTRCLI